LGLRSPQGPWDPDAARRKGGRGSRAGRYGACLRDERHRYRAGATPPPSEATPPYGCRSKRRKASTGATRTTPARRGGNPAWRRAETLPRQGSGTSLGKYADSPQVNARKGPAVQPFVASLPGDAIEGFEKVRRFTRYFHVPEASGLPGRQVSFAGQKALGPWSGRA
jgi:hypothetical protein